MIGSPGDKDGKSAKSIFNKSFAGEESFYSELSQLIYCNLLKSNGKNDKSEFGIANQDFQFFKNQIKQDQSSFSYFQNSTTKIEKKVFKDDILETLDHAPKELYNRIYYTGHGFENTGDWIAAKRAKGDTEETYTVSLCEVLSKFKGKFKVEIISDCCFSG